jgi:hypothetical protein
MYILTSPFLNGVTTFYCLIFDSPSAGGLLLHYIPRPTHLCHRCHDVY